MKDFILNNWQTLLWILIFIGVIVYYAITKKWHDLRTYAYKLIRTAEITITGTKRGQERFEQVLTDLYATVVPSWLRIFITKGMVEAQLKKWYYDVKDYLDDGVLNHSETATTELASCDNILTVDELAAKIAEALKNGQTDGQQLTKE